MKKLLTIIIPVYKVEPYINKCLDSCLLYTEDDNKGRVLDDEKMELLEVIIVNDGTPDKSADISRKYVKCFPRTFKQIDKDNGGHGSAWNVGLKEATGKYVRFLDSDDWLTNLNVLMKKLLETDADLVFTHMSMFYARENRNEKHIINDEYDVCKLFSDFNFSNNSKLHVLDFWNTTYKVSVLQYNKDLFLEHVMYDDGILFILPAIKANTYICYDFVLYNYFIGRSEQSRGQEKKINNIRARYRQGLYMLDFLEGHKNQVSNQMCRILTNKVCDYIMWFFFDLVELPYLESKEVNRKCYKYLADNSIELGDGKVARRFLKYPYLVFYVLEHLRKYKRFFLNRFF